MIQIFLRTDTPIVLKILKNSENGKEETNNGVKHRAAMGFGA